MQDAVIVSTVRTAVGKAPKGTLSVMRPDELGAMAIKGALDRIPQLEAAAIDDVIMGCAMPEGVALLSACCTKYASTYGKSSSLGWNVSVPKATMYVWAPIPEAYREMGSLEFAKKLLADARVAVSPGIGFGQYGDDHVRFRMIENEARTRQAIRGIRDMFRRDGLLKVAATG